MILALAGGVGGAMLALGLSRVLDPQELVIAVNTGDDFVDLGLHVSPDLDTVLYTLAGIANEETGWGLADETWQFMEALERLGGETWFRLGDRDLATHVERTARLAGGESLSAITDHFRARLGVAHPIVPMSDERIATVVLTGGRRLDFQDYFVRLGCEPAVEGFEFDGIAEAAPSVGFAAALEAPALEAIVLCPSNPFVSIAPITGIPAVARALAARRVPLVAVSPIVSGMAIKGPAAKMMRELGLDPSPTGIAAHYGDLLDGLVIDTADSGREAEVKALGLKTLVADTVMVSAADKRRLAEEVVAFARAIAPETPKAR